MSQKCTQQSISIVKKSARLIGQGEHWISPLISSLVKEQDISIFVSAEKYAINRWSPYSIRGLYGKVKIFSEKEGPAINHTAIRTYLTPNKHLELVIDCDNLMPGKKYTLGGTVTAAGKTALNIPNTSFTAKYKNERVTIKAPWKNPNLWDIGQPFLYDLNMKLSAEDGYDFVALPERFGFREVRFDKRLIKLNGRTINLFSAKPTGFDNYGIYSWMKGLGCNYVNSQHMASAAVFSRNKMNPRICDKLRFCDSAGLATSLRILHLPAKSMWEGPEEEAAKDWAFEEKVVSYMIRKYENCPSIFMWNGFGGAGTLGSSGAYNPLLMDGMWKRDFSDNPVMQKRRAVAKRRQNMIRNLDPSRKINAQESSNFNDVCHITYYTNMNPQQELIESNSYWVENGTKPYCITEYACPIYWDWFCCSAYRAPYKRA